MNILELVERRLQAHAANAFRYSQEDLEYLLNVTIELGERLWPVDADEDVDEFVTVKGMDLMLNGGKWKADGINCYWFGMMENEVLPTRDQIEEIFIAAKMMNANVIRSHTVMCSSGRKGSLWVNHQFNPAAWQRIDWAYELAEEYGIKLMGDLTDAYNWINGGYQHFCPPGVPKNAFFTDPGARAEFKTFIKGVLNHQLSNGKLIKNSPCLAMIGMGNELGNFRPGLSEAMPTYEWMADISAFIKHEDPNHLVLNCCDEYFGEAGDQDIKTIDVNTVHLYKTKFEERTNYALKFGKPVLIGEIGSKEKVDLKIFEKTCGVIPWSIFPEGVHHDLTNTFYPRDETWQKWKDYFNR